MQDKRNSKTGILAIGQKKQREAKFDFNEEELRPYFSLPRVLDGLFGLAKRIFDVTITAADGEAPVWHEDVRYFKIADESGEAIRFLLFRSLFSPC